MPTPVLAIAVPPRSLRRFLPGLLPCLVLAALALGLARLPWFQARGLGALSLAICLGMALGNSWRPLPARMEPGLALGRQRLLRMGVVLYGLRVTFQDIGQVGFVAVAIDALVLASTFGIAAWLGPRWFGLERDAALLIGAGSAICGAAAVMATAPVLRARSAHATVAVASVVIFGTLAMFTYPLLYRAGADHLGALATPQLFGVFIGSTVHEVAQVVVAGHAVGGEAEAAALITKMLRVMMLAPVLLLLCAWRLRGQPDVRALELPWFTLGFLAMIAFNSLVSLPPHWRQPLLWLDELLLATAMAALGMTTQVAALRRAGLRPVLLAGLLMAWLVLGGGAINLGMQALQR